MATYPLNPTLPPIEVDVAISINGDHITPISFGPSITYEFPETFTTDKLSEIIVGELPLSFTRLRGLFGSNSVAVTRSEGSATGISTQANVGFSSPTIESGGAASYGNSLKYTTGEPHVWDQPENGLYYPTLDFFPRYNQWFGAVTWPYPFTPDRARVPESYRIYLVYIDRVQKKVYWRQGKANFVVEEIPSGLLAIKPRISVPTATLTLSTPGNSVPFSLQLIALAGMPVTWSASELPSGLALAGDTISGSVAHPNPGNEVTFSPATVTATNNVGSTTVPIQFTILDPTLQPPTIDILSSVGGNVSGPQFGVVSGTKSVTFTIRVRSAFGSSIGTISAAGLNGASGTVNETSASAGRTTVEATVTATVSYYGVQPSNGSFFSSTPSSQVTITANDSAGRVRSTTATANIGIGWAGGGPNAA